MSGVINLRDELKKFCSVDGHKLKIITTTYCRITEPKAIKMLADLPNTEIKVSYNAKIERLHAKSYIFFRKSGYSTAYIGSSNLSHTAHTDGLEWNIRVTNVENPHIIDAAIATFDSYWNSPNFEDYDEKKFIKALEAEGNRWSKNKDIEIYQKFALLPHQKVILDKINTEREICQLYRNLIVAATGTGKTVISAFDYGSFVKKNPTRHKLLFIAHREEILKQSLATYRGVLGDYNFGDYWVNNHEPSQTEYLFVSIQTLNSKFEDFRKLGNDYYDYVVIDEVHHAAANSYKQIIDFFKPKILLGLTATPERMDGQSLLPDFGGKISAEIRLPQALDEGLLTPFQYLCITDPTDLTDGSLWNGNKYITSELSKQLCVDSRADLIIKKLREYLPDETQCKALCFCCDKRHAEFMAQKFKYYGLKADFLTSDSDKEHRKEVRNSISTGKLNYLFVVDIFNEGVDIPEIDTVLFLRPTESLTIFLQQLGRGLRLSAGKDHLTVFDFVAQLNNKYDFNSRFRALFTRQDVDVKRQFEHGFLYLPHGCSIYMEEEAQRVVLENIKSSIYNIRRLSNELAGYIGNPTLSEFLRSIGQDIRLLYKGNHCWTSLRRRASKCTYEDDEYTKRFEKGMGAFLHINSLSLINFIENFINKKRVPQQRDKKEEAYAVILYYALFQDRLSETGFNSIDEALRKFTEYPLFVQELQEIIEYIKDNLSVKTFAIENGMPDGLEQYGCYTREEVFSIFGRQTPERTMQGSVSGVFRVDELNTELFFVTLNKSDKDFSPSTQYEDYVVSENIFHWQSQNDDSHSNKGSRFTDQNNNGKKFVLFVRENKRDGYGNTCPFTCFGLVDYISSYGDYPMSINWKLQHKALPQFLKAV